MLEIKSLTKKYKTSGGDFVALNDISLSFPNTGLIALYGENGCGKTTMLNLLATLDTDYEGSIHYNGTDIASFSEPYRRNIVSVVLQENSFISYLNVRDNIAVFTDDESLHSITENLNAFDISEKSESSPLCLSGGQKQRVSLIRGLSKPSRILLVDEPTSSLNEAMEKEVFELLRTQAKGKLIILVSHNISLIRQYADMVVFMDKGAIHSVECLNSEEIEYGNGRIEVPQTIASFGILDTQKVKAMLSDHKEVVLCYSTGQSQSFAPDYTLQKDGMTDRECRLPHGLKRTIVFSSLRQTRLTIIGLTALLVVMAIMLGLLFSLAYFDRYGFTYRSIVDNVDGWIAYSSTGTMIDGSQMFGADAYRTLLSRYDSSVLLREEWAAAPALSFEGSGIYSPTISGIIYCDAEHIDLEAGSYADESAVMITDYLANGLILLDDEYSSVDDIFTKGIRLGDMTLSVMGIVNTDYEKYKGLYDDDAFSQSQAYIDYQQNLIIYRSLFLPVEALTKHDSIPIAALQYGEQFADIVTIDESDPQYEQVSGTENGCLLSPSLWRIYSESDIVKTFNGCLTVVGLKENGPDTNTVFVSADTFRNTMLGTLDGITSIYISLKTEDEVRSLEKDYNMIHHVSVSAYITKCVEIITILQNVFIVLVIAMLAVMMSAAYSIVNALCSNDRHLIGFMRICGYTKKVIFGIECIKTSLIAVISVILSETLLYVSVLGLNRLLSNLFGYSVSIIDHSILSFCMVLLGLVCVFALSLLRCIKSFRTQIVEMIR